MLAALQDGHGQLNVIEPSACKSIAEFELLLTMTAPFATGDLAELFKHAADSASLDLGPCCASMCGQ